MLTDTQSYMSGGGHNGHIKLTICSFTSQCIQYRALFLRDIKSIYASKTTGENTYNGPSAIILHIVILSCIYCCRVMYSYGNFVSSPSSPFLNTLKTPCSDLMVYPFGGGWLPSQGSLPARKGGWTM